MVGHYQDSPLILSLKKKLTADELLLIENEVLYAMHCMEEHHPEEFARAKWFEADGVDNMCVWYMTAQGSTYWNKWDRFITGYARSKPDFPNAGRVWKYRYPHPIGPRNILKPVRIPAES